MIILLSVSLLGPEAFMAAQGLPLSEATGTPLEAEDLLEKKILSLSIVQQSVYDVVLRLIRDHETPLSFIEAEGSAARAPTISLKVHNGSLKEVLDRLVAKSPEYRYEVLNNKLILYPKSPKYHLVAKLRTNGAIRSRHILPSHVTATSAFSSCDRERESLGCIKAVIKKKPLGNYFGACP